MDRLAVGEAISAGFRLVSREPLVFAGWIAVDFLVSILPSILLQATGAATNPAAAAGFLPVFLVLGWLLGAVLAAGVLRAVMTPDDRRGLYLRLGAEEGWLALAFLALGAILAVASVITILVAGVAVGSVAGAGGPGLIAALAVVYALALAVCVWLSARLGLSLPLSFRNRRLQLAEAWRLSRAQGGRIFAVLAVLTGLMVAAYAVVVGTFISMISSVIPLEQLSATLQRDPQALAKALDPNAVSAAGLLLLIIAGVARVAFFGAWADIDRQLSAPPREDVFS